MADDRKIILQLEIDAQKGIQNIISVKDRIAALKKEQAELNLTTVEGRKTYEAYNAQIKALTKEQKSLELAVEKTAAGFEFEAGSIAANRAELSKLTAEYKNLANPTKEQTNRIKELSDRLKEQESAIGNTSRNVGNYKEALVGIQSQIGAFGPEVQKLVVGFNGVSQGLKVASAGFKTLRGAIAATGIGVLVLAFTSLIQYFKQTDDGATKLEGVMGGLGAIMTEVSGFVAELGGRLIDLVTGAEDFETALSDLGDFILNNVLNRFKAFIVAGEAIGKLFSGDFKDAAKTGLDAFIQFQTGIEGGTDKISAFADQMAAAAKQAYEYALALDDINDRQRDQNELTAKNTRAVKELIKNGADKTKQDQVRIAALEKANQIEESSFKNQLALDKERQALLVARNKREQDAINQKLNRDIAEAKSEEEKNRLRQKSLSIQDKYADELSQLNVKITNDETEFIVLREKNQNRINALEEEIAAERRKRYEAYVKQLKEVNDLELSLEAQRQARVIANLDYELSKTELTGQQRMALLRLRSEEEIELVKNTTDEKLAILTKESMEEGANLQAIELEKIAIIEAANQSIIDIERKNAAEQGKIQEQITQKEKEEKKKRFDEFVKSTQKANSLLQEGLNIASSLNQTALQNDLNRNEKAREKLLRDAKGDKVKMEAINKRFDAINEERTKESTRNDLTIKEISAIANTATGFTQALAQGGPLGIITGALVLAAGAAQIANIESQKSKLADGGLLVGPSHDQGGITGTGRFGNVEVEGGEYVVKKSAVKALGVPFLNSINNIQKPKTIVNNNRLPIRKFANGGFLDGGLAARTSAGNAQEVNSQINAMQDAIQNLTLVVGVRDISSGLSNRAKVVDRANVTK